MSTEPEDDQVRIKSLNIVGGVATFDLLPPESFANAFVEAARASLEEFNAENYVEYEIRDGKTGERFAVVVQRVGRLTPHHARLEAEKERDEARATNQRLRDEAPTADAWDRLKAEIPRLYGRESADNLPHDSEYVTALHDVLATMKRIENGSPLVGEA
ncbi:hypothetical protein [Nocardiopsis sp. NRRL B-16309]|uniref:hypothetical protein n=1 Tax=Nocardiopsis sp. NRRL B-16309 TaxID=1519494 RepID=UPI0006ADF399|nr:hypothetical protein [Nocardiopsis sp. NRRL B-16309]KOX10163.1 hypothetical protein ADL05_26170 [Nocardiopsis sp. NRRL B-16309]